MRTSQPAVLTALLLAAVQFGCGDKSPAPVPPSPYVKVLQVVTGADQQGTVGQALTEQVVVKVLDNSGAAMKGKAVRFVAGAGVVTPAATSTDLQGQARTSWVLGNAAGAQHLEAQAVTDAGAVLEAVQITATAHPDVPASLLSFSGGSQSAVVGQKVPMPVVVRVADRFDNPVAGVSVSFTPAAQATPSTSMTGVDGRAITEWTLGPTVGWQEMEVTSGSLTPIRVRAYAILAALTVQVSTGDPADPTATITLSTCWGCHGSPGLDLPNADPLLSVAPPGDLVGSTTGPSVGSHLKHLTQGTFARPMACSTCHLVPRSPSTHRVQEQGMVTFSGLATRTWTPPLEVQPSFDRLAVPPRKPEPMSCSGVYCHGNYRGGNNAVVTWGKQNSVGCGFCHNLPPAAPTHPNLTAGTACNRCHPGYGGAQGDLPAGPTFSVNLATHIDGRLDPSVPAAVMVNVPLGDPTGGQGGAFASVDLGQCWTCHGTAFMAQANADPLASSAPPTDLQGRTSGPAVGAHQKHLVGGSISGPMECAACHLVPASLAAGPHPRPATGAVTGNVTFSRLATRSLYGQPAASPRWTQPSCSATYCHGNFRNGFNPVMDWTATGTAGCGTCHGLPPAGLHPALVTGTACSACHPGYLGAVGDPVSAMVVVNKALHLNGVVEVTGSHPPNYKDPESHGLAALDRAQGGRGMSLCTDCHVGFGPVGALASGDCEGCHATPSNYGPYTSGTYPNHTSWKTECLFCHGGKDSTSGAPPRNTHAISSAAAVQATTLATVGAHTSHVGTNGTSSLHGISGPAACVACHATGVDPLSLSHIDAVLGTVAFGAVGGTLNAGAYAAGGTSGDARSPSCSATYCHGAFPGGRSAAVGWTGSFSAATSTLGCNGCHGQGTGAAAQPPPFTVATPHPLNAACGDCHGGYTAASTNLLRHVDGVVQRPVGCTACHGELNPLVATQPVPRTSSAAAPGVGATATSKDVRGSSLKTSRGVGTHDVHLNGTRSARVACSDCHRLPATDSDVTHANGVAAVEFSGLAVNGNVTTAIWNGANGGTTLTCSSTYCHGTFFGGTPTTPTWTVAGTLGCTSCHGDPPPAATTGHPQNSNCAACHGAGYTSSGISGAAVATHVDGKITLIGGAAVGCTSCHGTLFGTPARVGVAGADVNVAAAPPSDSRGNTLSSAIGVGVHLAHVNQGATGAPISRPFACDVCHPPVGQNRHADGVANVTFSGVATNGGTSNAIYAGGACSSTYCHGNFAFGQNLSRSWTTPGKLTCNGCHLSPPPAAQGHVQNVDCASCHGVGYSSTGVTGAALATHLDGALTLSGGATVTCTSCHGTPGRVGVAGSDANVAASPPFDSHGNSLSSAPGVGVHLAHVNTALTAGARSRPFACGVCHPAVTKLAHANGLSDVVFSGVATAGNVVPSYAGGSCSATYCHGNLGGGKAATVSWTTPGQLACDSCHGMPPRLRTDRVSLHSERVMCGDCHDGYGMSAVNPATHVDGVVDRYSTPAAALCTACHGTPGYLSAATFSDSLVASAPPLDLAGSASGLAVGAHRAHLEQKATALFYFTNYQCVNCHVPSTSPDPGLHPRQEQGRVTFSSLATRNLAGGRVAPVWTAATGSCSATYCHGNFPGGKAATVSWGTPGPVACGSCHGIPPTLQTDGVTAHTASTACGTCHVGFTAATVDPITHGDGNVDVTPPVIRRRTVRYLVDLPLVQASTGRDLYFDVTGLTAGGTYTVTLDGMTSNADLSAFSDATYATEIAASGNSNVTPESLVLVATPTGTLHLVVYQSGFKWYPSEPGTGFTLKVQ
jgi:predicted CxxxxCH...CXXCH cytochrome family protein